MRFTINRPEFDAGNGTARFTYELDDLHFVESLKFPQNINAEQAGTASFANLLDVTAALLGTSYFKLKAPTSVSGDLALTPAQLALVRDAYENGLGEFYARNGISRFGQITYDFAAADPQPESGPRNRRALLPVGGGKDSLVSVQLLEAAGADFTPFAVNPKGPILTTIERTGRTPLFVERILDPEMLRLGQAPDYYNGHVPVTAINSLIAALVAHLFGYAMVVLSNERSASEGNQIHDHREVNHQHSKSLQAERLIANAIREASGGTIAYFSLLRPFSETRIGELFARDNRFDDVFSSCNSNFRLSGHDGARWCGACPKCHFVFLILAPFMAPDRLNAIFGQNLLAQPQHAGAYRELTGLAGQKPWECVGEILEAAAAMWHLSRGDVWRATAIVRELQGELKSKYGPEKLEAAWTDLMAEGPDHHIPGALAQQVHEHVY